MTKKERYVKKVFNEFIEKGWDTTKLLGRMKFSNVINNDKHFDKFKNNVKKERKYNKEREQIHKEYKTLQNRFEKNKDMQNEKIYQKLLNEGLKPREARQLLSIKINEDLPKSYILDKDIRGKLLSKKLLGALTDELEINFKGKGIRNIKAPLNRFYGEPRLRDKFAELEELSSKDKHQLRNINILMDKFMGDIIPQAYGDRKGTSVEFKAPTISFYMGLLDKLIHEYKTILKE